MNEEIEQTDDPQAESNESAPLDMRGYRLNNTPLNINMTIYAAMFRPLLVIVVFLSSEANRLDARSFDIFRRILVRQRL